MTSPVEHIAYFLAVCLLSTFASALIRLRKPREIARETAHFFLTVTGFVVVFGIVIIALEWIFVRPLL